MRKLILTLLLLLAFLPNAVAGTYMFREKPDKIKRWLVVKGESGTIYDCLYDHFSGLSGLASGTLYDHVDTTIGNLGYSGTMSDKLTAFFEATTSVSGWGDAERAFWANDSYSFTGGGSSGGFVFVDGNNFTFVDGNNFIFVT